MLYKGLISQIIRFTQANPGHAQVDSLCVLASAANQTVEQLLRTLDVREVGELRKVIPDAFPKKLRQGVLACSINTHNVWRVDPLLKSSQKFQILL